VHGCLTKIEYSVNVFNAEAFNGANAYNLSHLTFLFLHVTHERGFSVRPCASTNGLVGKSPSATSSSDLGAFSDGVCVEGGSPGRKSDGAMNDAGFLDGVCWTTLLADQALTVPAATLFGLVDDMDFWFTQSSLDPGGVRSSGASAVGSKRGR
jgi:hypothetical protein